MHYKGISIGWKKALLAGSVLAVAAIALVTLLPPPESVSADGKTFRQRCKTKVAVPNAGENPGLVSDCANMLEMLNTLSGDGDTPNWKARTPMSQWQGVTVAGTPSRVTKIELSGRGLSGTIPGRRLSKLSELTVLD